MPQCRRYRLPDPASIVRLGSDNAEEKHASVIVLLYEAVIIGIMY